ncbi:phosphoglycerate mutase-like protein [Marasmius fiardii PR-910]|nr:phosphoglycerate mutase-like protein [Marasmius fiardii PR-910]
MARATTMLSLQLFSLAFLVSFLPTPAMTKVIGAVVIARNGGRTHFYQDPKTYKGTFAETTALGEAESFQLGSTIRDLYLNPSSSSYVEGMRPDVVNNKQIKVRVKAGGEGTVVFDSAIAFLQGMFPPNPNNKIELANDTTVTAPLNGYQYVPVETVEPVNDRSLESWTDCPNFSKHVAEFHSSEEFKKKEKDAQPFFGSIKDFVFGRPTTLENAHNIFDYMNTELTYNKTYAHRLPPRMIEQARVYADFHENGVFSDNEPSGIGNIAGRTMLHTILSSVERISFSDDPLKFTLVETSYQPFISFFHEVDVVKEHPELKAIPDFGSALVIELRRGNPPDLRDFLRFRFRNGTQTEFKTLYVYGTRSDIPLTEFIYKSKNGAITSNRQWAEVCGRRRILGIEMIEGSQESILMNLGLSIVGFFALVVMSKIGKNVYQKVKASRRVRLEGQESDIIPTGVPVEKRVMTTV